MIEENIILNELFLYDDIVLLMVAENIPEIREMTATISNLISAKQTVKSYSDTV